MEHFYNKINHFISNRAFLYYASHFYDEIKHFILELHIFILKSNILFQNCTIFFWYKNVWFWYKNVRIPYKILDFDIKMFDFLIKMFDFFIKMFDFIIKLFNFDTIIFVFIVKISDLDNRWGWGEPSFLSRGDKHYVFSHFKCFFSYLIPKNVKENCFCNKNFWETLNLKKLKCSFTQAHF